MGNGIVRREIGDDIASLEATDGPKTCKLGPVVKQAGIRALRVGEEALKGSKRNTWLLVILLILQAKKDVFGVLIVLSKIIGKIL